MQQITDGVPAGITLWQGDSIEVLAALPDNSIDAIVTDPPYGLEFMGAEWDAPWKSDRRQPGDPNYTVNDSPGARSKVRHGLAASYGGDTREQMKAFQEWCQQWAEQCLRVLKPGGHIAAFGGTRTVHRLTCAVEDAGFEIRDSFAWIHGQGFPKSLDVTKALSRLVPADAQCVCAPRSIRTVQDSQDDYLSSRGFGDGPPRSVAGNAQGQTPSPACARVRSRDGQREDVQASVPTSISPDADTGLLSTDCSAHVENPVGPYLGDEPEQSYTQKSTSSDSLQESRRRAIRTQSRSGSDDDSASAPHQDIPLACPTCGKARIPEGYGSALKPAFEPIILARKPLAGTLAVNVLRHRTGALNIDAARIGNGADSQGPREGEPTADTRYTERGSTNFAAAPGPRGGNAKGRWPANVVLSHLPDCVPAGNHRQTVGGGAAGSSGFAAGYSNGDGFTGRDIIVESWTCAPGCPVAELDAQAGPSGSGSGRMKVSAGTKGGADTSTWVNGSSTGMHAEGKTNIGVRDFGDQGGPSRFFYTAKPDGRERPSVDGVQHPTVKSLDLMMWLVGLVTPKGGTVLDLFAGSGTTLEAAQILGFTSIGIEREPTYIPLILQRLNRSRTDIAATETERHRDRGDGQVTLF